MRILWDRAEATVLEVQTRLRPERDLAQTTIATVFETISATFSIAMPYASQRTKPTSSTRR